MKKINKNNKGFTIIELVIVIAVIAILAGVLIPTFSNVVDKANKSKVLQEARNIYTEYAVEHIDDLNKAEGEVVDVIIKSGDYYFSFTNGVVNVTPSTDVPNTNSVASVAGKPYYTSASSDSRVYIYTGVTTIE